MKTYFIKYVPVAGEIQEGDKFIRKEEEGVGTIFEAGQVDGDQIEDFGHSYVFNLTAINKVKMYLCSRNIQVGDKIRIVCGEPEIIFDELIVHEKYGDLYIELNDTYVGLDLSKDFKIIGEISPEAIWVKDGDEFDEEEIAWISDSGNDKLILLTQIRKSIEEDNEDLEPREAPETFPIENMPFYLQ